jgi:hypothetical protein
MEVMFSIRFILAFKIALAMVITYGIALSQAQQQDLVSLTQGDVYVNLVQVYKTLGGGWEIRQDKYPVELIPSSVKDQMQKRTKEWNGVLQ